MTSPSPRCSGSTRYWPRRRPLLGEEWCSARNRRHGIRRQGRVGKMGKDEATHAQTRAHRRRMTRRRSISPPEEMFPATKRPASCALVVVLAGLVTNGT